jgi:polyhydroxybutyrate depolymerase
VAQFHVSTRSPVAKRTNADAIAPPAVATPVVGIAVPTRLSSTVKAIGWWALGVPLALGALLACSTPATQPVTPDAGDPLDGGAEGDGSSDLPADAAPDVPPQPPREVVTQATLMVGGSQRRYTLSVPTSYNAAKPYTLLMVFHGDGGDGAGLQRYWRFEDVANEQAIIVYPDGDQATWRLSDPTEVNPDIDFVAALKATLTAKYNIYKGRTFGAGYSNGGFWVNQVACRKPGLFNGIGSLSGGAPFATDNNPMMKYPNGAPKCSNDSAVVPFIAVHGASDSTVDVGSGDYSASYWAYVNGCSSNREPVSPSPCEAHKGCPIGAPVVWCKVPGGHGISASSRQTITNFFTSLGVVP